MTIPSLTEPPLPPPSHPFFLVAFVVVFVGCVKPSSTREAQHEAWITVEPGRSVTLRFSQGALTFVTLILPEGAVRETTSLHLFIPESIAPVFPGAGLHLLTPAVALEPLNVLFFQPVTLTLAWLEPGWEGMELSQVYGFRGLTVTAVAEGQWATTVIQDPVPGSPVDLIITGGGLYFAALVSRTTDPGNLLGDPCAEAGMDGGECTAAGDCRISGCNSQWCGAGTLTQGFLCIPDAWSRARDRCVCTCFQKRCLWIR